MANQGGQPQYRRELAGEVRDLALKEIKAILLDKEAKVYTENFRAQVILKLASNVLPRVNEHSGPDGEPINAQVVILPPKTNESDKENIMVGESGASDPSTGNISD